MRSTPSNVAHSVRTRLLTLAKAEGEEFNYVLIRYALERFLVRLSKSSHRDAFIVKGATLFRLWAPRAHRPTKDLDLLGRGTPEPARLAALFVNICDTAVEDDGMVFDAKSVKAARIKEDAAYEGVRVTFQGKLGTARLSLQVDVGFGDAVTPSAIELDFPTMLSMTPPRLLAYRRETVVAEKLHAMVDLGIANSRMKDFFDIWFLSQNFDFQGAILADAIKATFQRRGTQIPIEIPFALTSAFHEDEGKRRQWNAFTSRITKPSSSPSLAQIIEALAPFLTLPLEALVARTPFERRWSAGGPWH